MSTAAIAVTLSTTAAVATAARREALGREAVVPAVAAVFAAVVAAGGAAAREVTSTMVVAMPGEATGVLAVVAPVASVRLGGEHTRDARHDGVFNSRRSTVARVRKCAAFEATWHCAGSDKSLRSRASCWPRWGAVLDGPQPIEGAVGALGVRGYWPGGTQDGPLWHNSRRNRVTSLGSQGWACV